MSQKMEKYITEDENDNGFDYEAPIDEREKVSHPLQKKILLLQLKQIKSFSFFPF
jgi:hypothetical protein